MSLPVIKTIDEEFIAAAAAVHGCRALLRALPGGETPPYSLLRRAVTEDGTCLGLIAPGDRTSALCLAAIDQNGCALRWVPPRVLDLPLCRVAIRSNPLAIREVPPSLLCPELVELALDLGCPPMLLPGAGEALPAPEGQCRRHPWTDTRTTRRTTRVGPGWRRGSAATGTSRRRRGRAADATWPDCPAPLAQ